MARNKNNGVPSSNDYGKVVYCNKGIKFFCPVCGNTNQKSFHTYEWAGRLWVTCLKPYARKEGRITYFGDCHHRYMIDLRVKLAVRRATQGELKL